MKLLKLAAVAATIVFTTSANAAIVTSTWTGTVVEGADGFGKFGTVGASLSGKSFVATLTFDTGKGTFSTSWLDYDSAN